MPSNLDIRCNIDHTHIILKVIFICGEVCKASDSDTEILFKLIILGKQVWAGNDYYHSSNEKCNMIFHDFESLLLFI